MPNIFHNMGSGPTVETLVENDQIKIERCSGQKQKLTADAFRFGAKNNLIMLLRGQLTRKDKTKFVKGDFTLLSSERKDEPEFVGVEEGSVWLSVSFNGQVGQDLFPSPDTLVLKKLKENMKRNVFIPRIDSLAETSSVRVERLAVDGNTRSSGDCEVPMNQFVLVMEGQADLRIQNEVASAGKLPTQGARLFENEKISLMPGDFITIPRNTPAGVESTKVDDSTVMLSIYFGGDLRLN